MKPYPKIGQFLAIPALLLMASHAVAADIKHAGALEFSPDGTLFVGDNVGGAIYAFALPGGTAPEKPTPINVENIDVRIAEVLGVIANAVEINDMAVHPVSQEVYISVTRGVGADAQPAIIKIDASGALENINLDKMVSTKQELSNFPDNSRKFQARGIGGPPMAKDIAKAKMPMSTLAIMDIEFHNNYLFVAGISNEEFSSTLRRIPFPFNGKQAASSVKIYHIAHDQYETRAPIRSMLIMNIDGKDQLVAAYTCSPIVLIPLDQIVDGAKITGNTIGDMGNGQPIDMVSYNMHGNEFLFITNNSRSPQVIPVAGLQAAKVVTEVDFERGGKQDLSPEIPYGPVGEMIMFTGSSLQIDLLNEMFFVSLTRDALTGSLDLESNFTFFPNRLHNLIAEYDFPGVPHPKM